MIAIEKDDSDAAWVAAYLVGECSNKEVSGSGRQHASFSR